MIHAEDFDRNRIGHERRRCEQKCERRGTLGLKIMLMLTDVQR